MPIKRLKESRKRDPFAMILVTTSYFRPKTIKNKKKYNRKRDKKINKYDLLFRLKKLLKIEYN